MFVNYSTTIFINTNRYTIIIWIFKSKFREIKNIVVYWQTFYNE